MASPKAVEHLRRLEAAELVRLGQYVPELEYWFKHSLIQETVYTSLLRAARTELHRQVAQAIEKTMPEGAPDRAGLLALHYDRAGRRREAMAYAVQAGDSALRAYALHEALRFYDQALATATDLADPGLAGTMHAAYAGRGRTLQALSDNFAALENYRLMLAAADADRDSARQADAINRLVPVYSILNGFTPELEAYLARALELARQTNDQLLTARALWNTGLAHRFRDPPRASSLLEQSLALSEATPADDEALRSFRGHVLNDLAITAWIGGRLRQSASYGTRALAVFRALDLRPMLADSLGGQGQVRWLTGEHALARQMVDEGIRLSRDIENQWAVIYNEMTLVRLDNDSGRLELALAEATETAAAARLSGFPPFHGMTQWQLSQFHLALGERDLGLAEADEAVKAFEEMRAPMWTALARAIAATSALEQGDLEAAWQLAGHLTEGNPERQKDMQGIVFAAGHIARVALESGHQEEAKRFCAWFLAWAERESAARAEGELRYWYGQAYHRAGDLTRAESELRRARELLTAAEVIDLVWRVDLALGRVLAAQGRIEEGVSCEQRARQSVQSLASSIVDVSLRRRFLAEIREVEGLAF